MKKILNIAAGKLEPLELPVNDDYILVNLDTMYYHSIYGDELESQIELLEDSPSIQSPVNYTYKVNEDVFKFLDKTSIIFDRIVCYRFLEHVSFTQVPYFIYLLSTCLPIDGIVDVIVPNYKTLAKMLLDENINDQNFESNNILLTTELLNEPGCPHASIWTGERVRYYFETLERRFKIETMDQAFEFDGRNIYIRFIARRVR